MEKTDVLVIGGSAAGVVVATVGKAFHPDKDVLVVRKEKQVLVPCGIPYIFGSLEASDQNLIPDGALSQAGVRVLVDEVVAIDPEHRTCRTARDTEIGFEKLVLALGSTPLVPGWLEGAHLKNVFTIPKDKEYIDAVLPQLHTSRKVVILGGGFIGVEVGDELNKKGHDVTIVEILPHVLEAAFDEEIARRAETVLAARGVKVHTGHGVKKILGNGSVTGVLLHDGARLEADAVVVAMGYRPQTELAARAGIPLNKHGFIHVDEYMRTEKPDILAIGDCAEKKSFITRTSRGIMLASTACAEARVAATNLYRLSAVRAFGGTIAIYSTVIGDTAFGVAGVTESLARERGFVIVTGTFEGVDKHPGTLAGTHKQLVKLIAARDSGVLLGGQVAGGASTGELTNLIGLAIENRMTIDSILLAQIGTHPLLTAPPTAYPLIKAAEVIVKKRCGYA
ncbi:MAG: FAD-dependent oxidoreductase [Planctomycetes bacterium]|nr:FAD-dependent oxidoreductase [Planctomycetota bacterium]